MYNKQHSHLHKDKMASNKNSGSSVSEDRVAEVMATIYGGMKYILTIFNINMTDNTEYLEGGTDSVCDAEK